MPTHAICECDYKVEVSDDRADVELRCPRCGRRITLDDTAIHHFLDGERQLQNPQATDSPHASSIRGYGAARASDPLEDDGENRAVDTEETVLVVNLDRIDTPLYDREDDSALNNDTPSGSSYGSKYDLTERVMHPISKPVLPTTPFAGPSDYEIHRILRVIQRGGMGRILLAYDQYLKREVAVKELRQDVAEDATIVRRFIGEAEITAQLEHPGIVPIHRLGQGQDGLPYYTMKMVKGETFQDAIKEYHRKPSKPGLLNLIRRLVSISKTMAFAHSKGVIHRDLKPANVMLGEHGETLVMDWGLAKPYGQILDESYVSIIHQTKQQRPELTMVGSIVGTPAFMSPEQANADDKVVGPLSDVFALGTVLYYLLAGQTAFSGRSTQEVLSKVRACVPIPPSEIKSTVPPGLEAICLKAMQKLPENRYQGASEFADDLCRWLDDEPILAIKDTFWTKTRRWLQHQRISPLWVISVIILSLLFAGVGLWIIERSRGTADNAKQPRVTGSAEQVQTDHARPRGVSEPNESTESLSEG